MALTLEYGLSPEEIIETKTFNTYVDLRSFIEGISEIEFRYAKVFGTGSDTSTSDLFKNYLYLTTIDLSELDTSNIENMSSMFEGCENLSSLNLSNFNTTNVTDMSFMFEFCEKLTSLDVSSFDTSNVEDMRDMFAECIALKTIYCDNTWTGTLEVNSEDMFLNCEELIGAIEYDSNKTNITYANPTNGYFTKKAIQSILFDNTKITSIYYNEIEVSKVYFNETLVYQKSI